MPNKTQANYSKTIIALLQKYPRARNRVTNDTLILINYDVLSCIPKVVNEYTTTTAFSAG